MARQPMVWIIDCDVTQRMHLQRELQQREFDTRAFTHGGDIERRLARERPDLLLLERLLEEEDGLELCRRIRRSGDDIPIIMITTMNEPEDRIAAFEFGVDDYLGKPFVIGELIARMQAQLRRRQAVPMSAPQANTEAVVFGECRLDLSTRTLTRAGKPLELTSGEFAVLAALACNIQRSLTRERLMQLARGTATDASERSIDVQISRLRRLVENDPAKPRHIQTVWGYGYVFVANASSLDKSS